MQEALAAAPFSCDTETCESCSAEVIDLDQAGHCRSCAELDGLLRRMTSAAGLDVAKTGTSAIDARQGVATERRG